MLSNRLLQFGSVTAALLLCAGGAALAKGKSKPPPLSIAEQGGFSFGGKVEINAAGESRHCDHGYTRFSIPTNARTANLPNLPPAYDRGFFFLR